MVPTARRWNGGGVAKRLGIGLQNRHTWVQIPSSPPEDQPSWRQRSTTPSVSFPFVFAPASAPIESDCDFGHSRGMRFLRRAAILVTPPLVFAACGLSIDTLVTGDAPDAAVDGALTRDSCTPLSKASACGTSTCGSIADGCGGTISCGTCANDQDCRVVGGGSSCVARPPSCKSCQDANAVCGSVSNGCNAILDCGTCAAGKFCDSANQCAACDASTVACGGPLPAGCAGTGTRCTNANEACDGRNCAPCDSAKTACGAMTPAACSGGPQAGVSCGGGGTCVGNQCVSCEAAQTACGNTTPASCAGGAQPGTVCGNGTACGANGCVTCDILQTTCGTRTPVACAAGAQLGLQCPLGAVCTGNGCKSCDAARTACGAKTPALCPLGAGADGTFCANNERCCAGQCKAACP